MNEFNYNKNSFSKAIGINNNVTIGRIVNEDRNPSYEIIEKILLTFGSIDANWLITGKGEMLKSKKNETDRNNKDYTSLLKQQISDLKESLKECRQDKKFMRSMLEDLKTESLPED
ncbi:MAG: hypothetical protein U9N85_01270 [Bacteroidota bacterium]|nr:hypothetical protein [Bacteroidota bacterium]